MAVKISLGDRLLHMYILGQTGTGKSTLLMSLMSQTERSGHGFCLLDAHGDLAEQMKRENVGSGVIYWDVSDPSRGFTYNPLGYVSEQYRTLAASGLLESLRHLWGESWGDRLENILRYTFLALLEMKSSTLKDVLRMLSDGEYREGVTKKITNSEVRRFWDQEYSSYTPAMRNNMIAPIQAKIGALLADPQLQSIFLSQGKTLSFRKAMDEGQIIIINLSKGKIGSDSANLLGAMLISTLGLAALSRANTSEALRRPFFIYVDECQNFTTLAFANMFSELRKFGVGLVLANQYLFQLKRQVRESILGNCGTLVSFRVGGTDAPFLAREFVPKFSQFDLLQLPNHRACVRLMIDGSPSTAFTLKTLELREAQLLSSNPFG